MLDGLLKPKFYSKCKSCLKLIKTRLETIRKKRSAVEKFLKKDIADLLKNGLDYNAYGRAEGVLVEQNMSACYELIAQFVGCIYSHVRDLCNHKECPDECKEAIPSLIYAAARFSDLPELRDLRTLFTEKFGNFLEPYTSKEFVERLRRDPPSKEMKIQLLNDLAQEFSIKKWNSKALEQKLYTSLLHEEKPKHDPQNHYGDVKLQKNDDDIKYTSKGNEREALSRDRKHISDPWRRGSETETTSDNSSHDVPIKACSSSLENDEEEIKRPFSYRHVPPPYVKESNLKKTSEAPPEKPKPRSVRRRRPLQPPADENTVTDSKTSDAAKLDDDDNRWTQQQQQVEYATRYAKSNSNVTPSMMMNGGTHHPPKDRTSSSVETLKGGHGRATSLVPEMLRTSGHVHPSLPDYDDFTARLASLRGN